MDFYFFQLINNLAGRWQPLDWFGVFCAEYLIFIMAFAIIVWTIFNKNNQRADAVIILEIILASFLSYLVKILVNLIYFRLRPFVAHDVNLLIGKISDGSFPSAHTFLSFVMAFGIYYYNKKLGIVLLILAAFVGISRIYVGVHYPSDVLGGIILAWLSVYLVNKVNWKKLLKI
ncbi:phosphatase PAP2 family protein [Candidatus Falkowbacteria bacterium]|nr:phosphatase PAP2 family protein [Candidatus Falkowbacteria bacterium]